MEHIGGVLKRHADALAAGGDENGIQTHALGHGVGDGVAQNNAVLLCADGFQNGLRLFAAGDGENIEATRDNALQRTGRVGDAGEADDRNLPMENIGQSQHRKNVVDGKGNLYHRNGNLLAQKTSRAAAGDDDVIVFLHPLLHHRDAGGQVAEKYAQLDVRKFLGYLVHQRLHAFIGRDAQYLHSTAHAADLQVVFPFYILYHNSWEKQENVSN